MNDLSKEKQDLNEIPRGALPQGIYAID